MAGLTITEKEHWKERIARRIDKKIDVLLAIEPNLMDRLQHQAHALSLDSLGLTQLQVELDAVAAEEEALEKRKEHALKAMLARVQGVLVEEVHYVQHYGCETHPDVIRAVQRRQAVHEDELLAQHPTGQRILQLRKEKEELLDTVWLATSGQQIKELWQKVSELLGDEPSPLQRQALTIPNDS